MKEDKRRSRATSNLYRISENELHSNAWLGGIGGFIALLYYQHKTSKETDFLKTYLYRGISGLIGQVVFSAFAIAFIRLAMEYIV